MKVIVVKIESLGRSNYCIRNLILNNATNVRFTHIIYIGIEIHYSYTIVMERIEQTCNLKKVPSFDYLISQ